MIPLSKPIITQDDIDAVNEVLRSGKLAQGNKVAEFETAFADYIGTDFAIAVNSGTAALQIALQAHGIKSGDEVITTPFSFIATANAILYNNAKPVFVDIDIDTYCIDSDLIQESITDNTKAILPVHIYGHPADIKAIMDIAYDYDLVVIEDACQSHGAEYKNKKVGSFGTGAFSFYPTKNMTTGEGGMITTNEPEIYERARMIRNHGSEYKNVHELLGYNFRMTDIEAALGLSQLSRLDDYNNQRIENAQYLSTGLNRIEEIVLPITKPQCKHVFNQYTIRFEYYPDMTFCKNDFSDNEIEYGVYYPKPIYKQEIYSKNYNFNTSQHVCNTVLSIPVHPSLSKHDMDLIINTIKGAVCLE